METTGDRPVPPARDASSGRQPSSLAASLPDLEFSLLELADRLLEKGVVLNGEATISVAGVDLIYLGLNAVLSSVDTIVRAIDRRQGGAPRPPGPAGPRAPDAPGAPPLHPAALPPGATDPTAARFLQGASAVAEPEPVAAPVEPVEQETQAAGEVATLREEVERLGDVLPSRVNVDPEGVEQGLAKLVLTLIQFLRVLLERQAVRRMDAGSLTEQEVERIGVALMRLEQKIREIALQFGLQESDLNLNLGPLGTLL